MIAHLLTWMLRGLAVVGLSAILLAIALWRWSRAADAERGE